MWLMILQSPKEAPPLTVPILRKGGDQIARSVLGWPRPTSAEAEKVRFPWQPRFYYVGRLAILHRLYSFAPPCQHTAAHWPHCCRPQFDPSDEDTVETSKMRCTTLHYVKVLVYMLIFHDHDSSTYRCATPTRTATVSSPPGCGSCWRR